MKNRYVPSYYDGQVVILDTKHPGYEAPFRVVESGKDSEGTIFKRVYAEKYRNEEFKKETIVAAWNMYYDYDDRSYSNHETEMKWAENICNLLNSKK